MPHSTAKHAASKQATSKVDKKKGKRKAKAATLAIKTTTTEAVTATATPALLGDQQVESALDSNTAGMAEAFPFTASLSGTAQAINVYVDSHNKATTILAAVYQDNSGRPGALVASGSLSSPQAGAWNALPITATGVSASKSYWIAVLGNGGTMYFRDRAKGPCQSVNSRESSLTAFPSTWRNGARWNTCPISAFVSGTASAVTSQTTTTTSTTTQTTTSTPTTTTTSTTTTTPPPPPTPPANTALPTISGTATQGQTLNTSSGTWTGNPTFTYQWQDCDSSGANCSNISGATSTSYTLTANDVSHTIRVVVTGTNTGGSAPATSAATSVVQASTPAAPTETALPTISGTATQGQTLNTSSGTWTGNPTFTYQWQDCDSSGANCSNISGATSTSYTLTANDVSHTIRVVVTGTNAGGSTPAVSAATAVVASSGTSTMNCMLNLAGCGFPDAGGNDGAHGTLTPATGTVSLAAGQIYQNVALHGEIIVTGNNVTISNVSVTDPGGPGIILGGGYGVPCHSGTLIQDVTITGTGNTSGTAITDGVYNEGCGRGGTVSATGVRIYCHDSQQTCWNGSGKISDSYMITDVTIPGNHTEPVFETGGDAGVQLNHDTLLNPIPQTADVFESTEGGQSQYNTITNSLLAGGGYPVYAGDGTTDPVPSNAPPVITNNRFARCLSGPYTDSVGGGGQTCSSSGSFGSDAHGYYPKGGYFGLCPACEGQGSGSHTTWTGNVWDDNNATVPHP